MGRRVGLFALCVAIISMIGCGGRSDTTQQLRIVMASPDAPPVDILIDGNQVGTALAYTNSTAYPTVKIRIASHPGVDRKQFDIGLPAKYFDNGGRERDTLLLTGPVAHMRLGAAYGRSKHTPQSTLLKGRCEWSMHRRIWVRLMCTL